MKPFDTIRISGTATSPIKEYKDLICVIATVSDDGYLKVWPLEETPEDGGKIWFDSRTCEITMIEEDE